MNPLNFSHHEGISCDHCMKSNFRGKRYKCLICPDYDLCSSCYENGTVPAGKRHTSEHAVQCILTRNDYDIYFSGESTPVETIQSFTCPICGKMGFTEQLLYEHSVQEHSETFTEVACPICCTMANVEPGLQIEDFTSHLSLEHRSGRGYEQQASSALRGRRAPHTNRSGVNLARNQRRQLTPTTVTMLSNINPLLSSLPHDQLGNQNSNSQIRDLDPITELLSQLRRSQNASLSSNQTNANPLHLHLDRNNFRGSALRHVFERPSDVVLRRNNQTILNQPNPTQLSSNGIGLSYLLMDTLTGNQTVPNSNNLTNQGSQPSGNQFLLSTCKEKPKLSKELEAEKLNKSLFIQELLISSIANFFRHDLKFEKASKNSQLINNLDDNETKNDNLVDNKSINQNNESIDNQINDEKEIKNEESAINNLIANNEITRQLETNNNTDRNIDSNTDSNTDRNIVSNIISNIASNLDNINIDSNTSNTDNIDNIDNATNNSSNLPNLIKEASNELKTN